MKKSEILFQSDCEKWQWFLEYGETIFEYMTVDVKSTFWTLPGRILRLPWSARGKTKESGIRTPKENMKRIVTCLFRDTKQISPSLQGLLIEHFLQRVNDCKEDDELETIHQNAQEILAVLIQTSIDFARVSSLLREPDSVNSRGIVTQLSQKWRSVFEGLDTVDFAIGEFREQMVEVLRLECERIFEIGAFWSELRRLIEMEPDIEKRFTLARDHLLYQTERVPQIASRVLKNMSVEAITAILPFLRNAEEFSKYIVSTEGVFIPLLPYLESQRYREIVFKVFQNGVDERLGL